MDEIVRAALKKWPGVPEVYGWLHLDSRGRFRLRAGGGDPPAYEAIGNAALAAFIARNYQGDARGRWYFQNGPQKVYVQLAVAPWVFRLQGTDTVVAHTGTAAKRVDGLVIDSHAAAILLTDMGPGLVDDRDLGELLQLIITSAGRQVDEAELAQWMAAPDDHELYLAWAGARLPVLSVARDHLGERFAYNPDPRPVDA